MARLPVTMTFNVVDSTSKALAEIHQRLGQINSGAGQFNKILEENKSKLSEFTKASKTIGKGLLTAGGVLTAGITVPVIGLGVAALKAGADYEQAMNDLQARTQSSTGDMALLSAEARRLGTSTVFGATDASKAMTELGKAGFTTQEIIASTGSVLNLAAAESLDMGAAATLVSDTINQFGLKASDATSVVDMLGKAAGISSIDIAQLQNSLKYAAPEAARFGIKLEETAGAIALLGSSGIKSEMAGTSLRSFFNSITADTERQNKLMKAGVFGKDLFINKDTLKSLPEMLAALKLANLSATQLTEIFGKEFSGPISTLIRDSDKLGKTISEVANSSGFEAEVAAARTKGWNGEVQKLKNAFEELNISLSYGENGEGSPLEYLTKMVSATKGLVDWFHTLNPAVQTFVIVSLGVAAALGPILIGFGAFLFALPEMILGFGILTGVFSEVTVSAFGLSLGLSSLLLGIPLLIAGGIYLVTHWQDVVDMFKTFGNVLVDIINDLGTLAGFKNLLPSFSSTLGNETSVVSPNASSNNSTFGAGPIKPAFDSGNFSDYYSQKNPANKNQSEVLIKLGGYIPPGTTTVVNPNSDAFVTLDMGRAMQ